MGTGSSADHADADSYLQGTGTALSNRPLVAIVRGVRVSPRGQELYISRMPMRLAEWWAGLLVKI